MLPEIEQYPLPVLNLGDRRIFTANMQFMYALIVASEPLLLAALERELPDGLREFYTEHYEEERGHADMLRDDLQFLGAQPEMLDWNAPQIAGMQYYLVKHGPPEALLGYMAALESRPMPMAMVDALGAIHGENAVRTLRHHARHDVQHSKEIEQQINAVSDPGPILVNARLTASLLAQALGRIQ